MSDKKISIAELIRIAKSNKDKIFNKDVSENLDDPTRFVIAFKIKDGRHKVLAETIYSTYCKWSSTPMRKIQFFMKFAKLFESHRGQKNNHYFLNYKPEELLNYVEKMKVDYDR